MLVDSHCHLDSDDFEGELGDIIERAKQNGIEKMVTISVNIEGFPKVLKIAESYDNVYCSVGIHPNEVHKFPQVTQAELLEYCNHPKVVGVGETGMDLYYSAEHKEAQIQSLRTHINVSRKTGLPVIIHTRDADEETYEVLKQAHEEGTFPGLIHCFTAGAEFGRLVVDMGFFVSISGIVTFKKATALQEIVRTLPLDKMLVETDAPWLAPTPYRGKRNEPSYVKHTANFIADLRGLHFEKIEKQTTENFFRLFKKCA